MKEKEAVKLGKIIDRQIAAFENAGQEYQKTLGRDPINILYKKFYEMLGERIDEKYFIDEIHIVINKSKIDVKIKTGEYIKEKLTKDIKNTLNQAIGSGDSRNLQKRKRG